MCGVAGIIISGSRDNGLRTRWTCCGGLGPSTLNAMHGAADRGGSPTQPGEFCVWGQHERAKPVAPPHSPPAALGGASTPLEVAAAAAAAPLPHLLAAAPSASSALVVAEAKGLASSAAPPPPVAAEAADMSAVGSQQMQSANVQERRRGLCGVRPTLVEETLHMRKVGQGPCSWL
jgi:hypothetical protein